MRFINLMLVGAVLSSPAFAGDHLFVGATKCKTCHGKEDIGNQYAKWANSPHAKAMKTLATDKAKKWATEAGVGDPTTAEACVKCHTTAYGVDAAMLGSKFSHAEGVGCESCHGAGNDYKKKAIMTKVDDAKAKGLIIPTEALCVKCHNDKSPAWPGSFNFKEAVAKIAHPVPEGYDPFAEDEEDDDDDEY